MSQKRIIPCLDMKDGRVVKGIHFVDLADIGDPAEIARRYEEQGADEIVFLDISATTEGRQTHYALIERTAKGIEIPIAVGGGVRTVEDVRTMRAAGASKVSINSAAVSNPALIAEASAEFGKDSVIVAIDAGRVGDGFHVFVNGGQVDTGLDLITWAKECEKLGAGEILLTSIDKDGVQDGYDIELTRQVVEVVSIPVTASGGCGSIDHIIEVFQKTDCAAALAASLFHYGKATVEDVKREMERNGISCRR